MMEGLFAPLEVLRRDLERIKAAVDSTAPVNPLKNPVKKDMDRIARVKLPPLPGIPSRTEEARHQAAEELRVEENLLTTTQHEVLRLAAEGLSNREIAERLGIVIGTVRVHLKDIRRVIGVATREEAVAAFGEPTERERVPISILRLPRPPVPAAPYERRAAGLLPLVDELERSPSMETVGILEDELHDLAGEVIGARALTSGIEATRFSELHSRLASTIEEVALARAAIKNMERETLPMRIEAARRGFLLRIQAMRENLRGAT